MLSNSTENSKVKEDMEDSMLIKIHIHRDCFISTSIHKDRVRVNNTSINKKRNMRKIDFVCIFFHNNQQQINLKLTKKITLYYIINILIILLPIMQQVGAQSRRKSYGNCQISMPRHTLTREGIRTVYKQIPPPSQQLKGFRRRMVFQTLPSVGSLPEIYNNGGTNTARDKYSFANETTSRKNNQTLMTMGSQTDIKIQKSTDLKRSSISSQPPSISPPIQSNPPSQTPQPSPQKITLNIDDPELNAEPQNLQQQIQGYTMGNQIQQQQQEEDDKNKNVPKIKSYSSTANVSENICNRFEVVNEPQARMEMRYLRAKFQLVRSRREDNQFMKLVNQYKMGKQEFLKQSARKMEAMRAVAAMRRATSLPKLNHNHEQNVQQIIVPSFQQLANPDGNPEQSKRKLLSKRLQGTMSFGRLQLSKNNNSTKNINYDEYLKQEMNYALQTQRYLRQKGIRLNPGTLKNSLINIRQIPVKQGEEVEFPTAKLLSNPFHPKDTGKKKKK